MKEARTPPLRKLPHLLLLASAFAVAPTVQAAITGPLAKTVARGRQIFLHDTFNGRGLTCNSCHTGGGLGPTRLPGQSFRGPSLANAAAVFPRFKPREGKVLTLEDEIHGCIRGAIGGTPPAYDSSTMSALTAYLTSLSQGKRVDMGGAYK